LLQNAVEASWGNVIAGLSCDRDPAQLEPMLELAMASLSGTGYQPSSRNSRSTSLTFIFTDGFAVFG
jgi:hypothetical protein